MKSTSGSFGGMKKGFLFGGGGSQKKVAAAPAKSTKNDIPFIRPKSTLEEERQLPEVQQAMQAGQQFLQNKGKTNINTYQQACQTSAVFDFPGVIFVIRPDPMRK